MKTVSINKTALAAAISSVLMLQGCSDTTNDTGVATIQPNGAVVDDYIAFSRIYVDANNNNTFDRDREPYAYTDANGQFGGEYCKNPYDPLSYKFCLDIPENLADKPIRVEGGRDILTGMEYEGAMSMQLDGETQDLAITSFSTLKEVINNIDTDNLPPDLKNKYQDINIEQLIKTLVPDDEASAQFKLGQSQSLNKQNLLLPKRTSFSTFKHGIAIHKVAEIIAAYLKQKNGEDLRSYMPAVYAAIAANFNADQGDITQTTFKNIIKEADKLKGFSLNSTDKEIEYIAKAALNIYNFSTGQRKPDGDNDNSDTRRIPLAKAEILTQSAKKAVANNDDDAAAKAKKLTEILTDNTLNQNNNMLDNLIKDKTSVQKLDFETAAEKFSKAAEKFSKADGTKTEEIEEIKKSINNLEKGEYDLNDFVTKVIGADKYIELNENKNNVEKIIKAYFQETEQNDTQHNGKITLCAYDSSKNRGERAAIFTGNWAWDEHKTYQLRAEALGVQVSIEHLNPDLHSGADECNGDSTTIKTCLRVNRPQIGEDTTTTQYFTSSQYYLLDYENHNGDITGLDKTNDIDALIDKGKNSAEKIKVQPLEEGASVPDTVEQCFPNKEL